jgi:hypothetical protein
MALLRFNMETCAASSLLWSVSLPQQLDRYLPSHACRRSRVQLSPPCSLLTDRRVPRPANHSVIE